MSRLAAQLPAKRARWRASLDTTCMITRTTATPDGAGGTTLSTTTLAPVACRLQPGLTTPTEPVQGGRVVALDYWDVQLPYDADVQPTDVINGAYQVQGVTTGRSLNYGLTARCVRVQG